MINVKQIKQAKHHVGFAVPASSSDCTHDSPSNERSSVEDSRQLNSRREFQIRKTSNSGSKRRPGGKKNGGQKSPSEFTNVGAKSVVSIFTSQSGKTNHSAPVLGNEETSSQEGGRSSSPSNSIKLREEIIAKKKKILKSKIRPASSISPSKPLLKQTKEEFANSLVSFKKEGAARSLEPNKASE